MNGAVQPWGHVHVGSSLQDGRREQVRKWLILSGGAREDFLEEVAFFP